MKKMILIAGTLLTTIPAIAQLSIAPEAGFQMTNVKIKIGGDKVDTKMKPGFRAGANLDLGLSTNLHLQAGLFYSAAGHKMEEQGAGLIAAFTTSYNYLQVPVYLNYMTGKAGGNRFFAGAGPYFGYAVKATAKTEDGPKNDIRIGTKAGRDVLKPMDFGVNINAGYMLAMGAYVRAHYSLGLSNNFPGGDSERSMRNNGFGISLGYAFKL